MPEAVTPPTFEKGSFNKALFRQALLYGSLAYKPYNFLSASHPWWANIIAASAAITAGYFELKSFSAHKKRGKGNRCLDCDTPCPLNTAVDAFYERGEGDHTGPWISNEVYNSLDTVSSNSTKKTQFRLKEDNYSRTITMKPNENATNGYNFECKLNI